MRLKEITWDNPNKMHMDSGYKLFDKQTNLISTGNVWANTQYSNYIRPWNEVDNYGYKGEPGQFLKFDMQFFGSIPNHLREIIYDKNREKSVILYEFKVYHGERKEIIGHILTTGYEDGYKYLGSAIYCPYGANYTKRSNAVWAAARYICDNEGMWAS